MIQTITLIGAGNLSVQLGKALHRSGFDVLQVYSRTADSAKSLAYAISADWTTDLQKVDLSADLIIIAVKDDAIETVLSQLLRTDKPIVHTSGSIPMNLLAKYTSSYGVFYPLQTFSKTRDVNFADIPICLEASSDVVMAELKTFATKLSRHIEEVNSEKRRFLHLAAVFACNFVNHCYFLGGNVLEEEGLMFDLLKPLIRETAGKVVDMSPFDAQTGPAKRYDISIIEKHLELLEDKDVYQIMTESIHKTHKI